MAQSLTGGPRAGLDPADVAESLTLTRPPTIRHGVDVLNLAGVLTKDKLQVTGGSVSWAYRPPELGGQRADVVAAVRGQGTVDVVGDLPVDLTGVRLRPWTEWLLRTGQWARWHLGVLVITNPGAVAYDGTVVTRTLTLADKSHLWWTTPLAEPLHLPGSTVAVAWVKAKLAEVFGETSFAIASSDATIGEPRTFEAGTSWLDVFSRVMESVGMDQLTADEDGRPASQALSVLAGQGPFVSYGPGAGKVVPAGSVRQLLPSLPNVVIFSARQGPSLGNVEGNGLAVRRNASTGPSSVSARGREVVHRVDVDVDSQAALEAVADADAQRYFAGGGLTFSGSVALNPRFGNRDVVGLTHPRLGFSGAANVTSWTYPLRPFTSDQDVLMPITAERRVVLS